MYTIPISWSSRELEKLPSRLLTATDYIHLLTTYTANRWLILSAVRRMLLGASQSILLRAALCMLLETILRMLLSAELRGPALLRPFSDNNAALHKRLSCEFPDLI